MRLEAPVLTHALRPGGRTSPAGNRRKAPAPLPPRPPLPPRLGSTAAAPRRGPNRASPYRPRHRAERSAQRPLPGPSRARRPRSAPWAAGRAWGWTLRSRERSSGAAGPRRGPPLPEDTWEYLREPDDARLLTCSCPPHGPIFGAPRLRHRNAACLSAGPALLTPRSQSGSGDTAASRRHWRRAPPGDGPTRGFYVVKVVWAAEEGSGRRGRGGRPSWGRRLAARSARRERAAHRELRGSWLGDAHARCLPIGVGRSRFCRDGGACRRAASGFAQVRETALIRGFAKPAAARPQPNVSARGLWARLCWVQPAVALRASSAAGTSGRRAPSHRTARGSRHSCWPHCGHWTAGFPLNVA